MSSFFSSDGSFSLQFAIIFAVIFLVLAGVVLAFRRFTGKGMALSAKAGSRGRQPRLGIVDIYELDRQRQLILLRRDNVEHLLLVGGPNDVVIERNINRSIGARLPAEETDDEPAPEAAAVPYAAKPPQAAPYLEPTFEMPVVVQTPPPAPDQPALQVGRPLDETVVPKRYDDAPDLQPVAAPSPRRAQSHLAGAMRRTPPSLVNLVPGSAAMRSPASEERPSPVGEVLPAPVVAPTASRAIDAAILSDMARQLEEALRRPAAAVRPAVPSRSEPDAVPSPVEPPDEAPAPEPATLVPEAADIRTDDIEPVPSSEVPPFAELPAEPHAVDPIAAAMATAAPPSDDLFDERDGEAEPISHVEAPVAEAPHAVDHEPELVQPEPTIPAFAAPHPEPASQADPEAPLPPVAEPEPPGEPAPPQKKPASATPNPFSVEEIEAEFARLLGRPLDRKT